MHFKRSPFIALLILLIIVVSCGVLYLWLVNSTTIFKAPVYSRSDILKEVFGKNPSVEVPKIPSVLDGTLVAPALANRHPLGVVIENHPDARPQSGLSKASVVYEAIAEGGITRFLAIFGPNSAKVGPIRSARTYFVDWCNEFDCFLSHVGGNADALYEKIPQDKVKDLDEFGNAGSYHREAKVGLATEHTMYAETHDLFALATTKKWGAALRDDYNIFSFLDDPPKSPVAGTSTIDIDYSTPQYLVTYQYDSATNSYKRFLAGAPHLDANTKTQITVNNVIIQYLDRTPVVTSINEQGWSMATVGSGKATIYQGGTKIQGSWKKTSSFSRTQFFDASGKLISLYRGNTWIHAVNPGSTVTDK